LAHISVYVNALLCKHKLREVDNECALHISIVLAICVPKIIKFGGNMTKFWQKQVGSFFWHTLYK